MGAPLPAPLGAGCRLSALRPCRSAAAPPPARSGGHFLLHCYQGTGGRKRPPAAGSGGARAPRRRGPGGQPRPARAAPALRGRRHFGAGKGSGWGRVERDAVCGRSLVHSPQAMSRGPAIRGARSWCGAAGGSMSLRSPEFGAVSCRLRCVRAGQRGLPARSMVASSAKETNTGSIGGCRCDYSPCSPF